MRYYGFRRWQKKAYEGIYKKLIKPSNPLIWRWVVMQAGATLHLLDGLINFQSGYPAADYHL